MLYSGKLIKSIRKYHNLKLTKLCDGVCTYSQLARIERGERNAEKLLFECIYQRMGKYSGRFEELLDYDEYVLTKKRWNIQQHIDCKRFEQAEKEIDIYMSNTNDKLHLQLLHLYKCEVMHKTNKAIEVCMDILMKGLHFTIPHFDFNNLEMYYLGRTELYIITQYVRYTELLGNVDEAVKLYHRLLKYISKEHFDRSERGNHFRHIGYWLTKYYLNSKMYDNALEIAEKTYDEIIKNDFWCMLYEIKESIIICKEKKGNDMTEERKFLEIFKKMNQAYNVPSAEDFFPRYVEERVYNFNSFIKQRRLLFGLSQEEMAFDICDVTTLSRMESNKLTIRKKYKAELLKKVNLSGDEYIAFIDTYDYRVFENINKLNDCIKQDRREDIQLLIKDLKKYHIDNTANTQQCLLHRYNIKNLETMEPAKQAEDYRQILLLTLNSITNDRLNGIMLTANEWQLIYTLSRVLKENGDLEQCIKLFEPIWDTYSKLSHKNFSATYIDINSALGEILGELGNVTLANKYLEEGLFASAQQDTLLRVADFTYDFSWNILEMTQNFKFSDIKKCEQMLSYAYLVCKIYGYKHWQQLIIELCNKHNLNVMFV